MKKKSSKSKRACRQIDYYSWFVVGLVWMVIGIPLGLSNNNWGIFAIGIVFLALGLSHKKDWKKYPRPCWKDLTRKQKMIKIAAIILAFLIAAAFAFYLALRNKGI